MTLQVLVSTMYQTDHNLIQKMNIQSDAVIINQCDINKIEDFRYKTYSIKWIDSSKRKLSSSRNMALENAINDICILSDDDMEYVTAYDQIILEQFNKYPDAHIIAFQVEGIEKQFKNYYPKKRKLNYLTSMKVYSVEIAFRLNSIKEANISFDEMFGAGSKFFMGEENIFLYDCLKSGLNIFYVPQKIANIHMGESSWFKGYNKDYFISKGAAFTAMSKPFSILFILQFAIRKYKLFSYNLTITQALNYMFDGRKQYIYLKNTNS